MYETREEIDSFFGALFDCEFVRKLGEGQFGLALLAYHQTEELDLVFKLPKDRKTTLQPHHPR